MFIHSSVYLLISWVVTMFFAFINNASVNILAQIFVLKYAFNFLGIIARSRIAWLSMFNFLKNCQTVLHHNYTMLYSHQQCMGISLHITLAIIWLLLLLYYHYYCHASRYKVISHCNFHLYFPHDYRGK